MLIRVEHCDGLEYVKEGMWEKTLTYLNQQEKMNGFGIFVREYEREVKCCPSITDVAFSA
jgi:hypothetical protein